VDVAEAVIGEVVIGEDSNIDDKLPHLVFILIVPS
jgi:hypothetical protein